MMDNQNLHCHYSGLSSPTSHIEQVGRKKKRSREIWNRCSSCGKFICLSKFVIIMSLITFVIFRFNSILNEHKGEINYLKAEVLELNEYIDDLIDYIENEPDPIIEDKIVYKTLTRTLVDTVLVETVIDFYDIEPIRVVDFSITDKGEGFYTQLDGYAKFMWNMHKADYDVVETEITNKILNLNMSANYLVLNNNLNLKLNTQSPDVTIMYIENEILDLRRVYVPERNRWGIGITGGFGFVNSGFTPFIGVGATYQFMDISFKK